VAVLVRVQNLVVFAAERTRLLQEELLLQQLPRELPLQVETMLLPASTVVQVEYVIDHRLILKSLSCCCSTYVFTVMLLYLVLRDC